MTSPTAFLSHATEDKDRFAVPLAKRLLAQGIDVWVDQWEIKAGDSLVKKVFTSGIDNASVFIVVLSRTSITKPWVSEELDAAVIRKIEGSCKIIPVLLDDLETTQVPQPLRHLLWVSASKHGLDGTATEIVRSVYDLRTKPPLGPAPAYLSSPYNQTKITHDPTDNLVLNLIIDQYLEYTQGAANHISPESLAQKIQDLNISKATLDESVAVLANEGTISIHRLLGGGWFLDKIPDHTLLSAWKARGIDVDDAERRLLASIVNAPYTDVGDFEGLDPLLIATILRSLKQRGLIHGQQVLGGKFIVMGVSPAAARLVR